MLRSGAYGWHNGVFNQIHVPERLQWGMREGTVTYAQRLAAAGYRTGYCGKWHADWVKGPLDYGYHRASAINCLGPEATRRLNLPPEDCFGPTARKHPNRVVAERVIHWPGGDRWPVWQEYDGPIEGRHAHFLASRAVAMLDEFAGQPAPWLLEVHFPEPHDPFAPHVEFARRYSADDVPLPGDWHEEHANKPGMNRREAATYAGLSEQDVKAAIAHYWALNEELDHNIGRVLERLDQLGQRDNTLVVLSSDHGELLGNHGMFIKGWMPYEQTHRVPMVARFPRHIPAGSRANQLVHLHDWAHTFCEVAGAEPLPFADGVSLTNLLADPANTPSRPAIMNTYYGGEFLYTQRILITERYKYVFNGFDIDEVYDLESDPAELVNRVDDPSLAEVVADLRRRLYAEMDRLGDPYAGNWLYHAGRYLPNPPPEAPPEARPETLPQSEPATTTPSRPKARR
jgi:arylsulfatase A-like enzyme